MYTGEEARKATLEYFDNDELATDVFLNKYALKDKDGNFLEKTPTEMHWRLANEFARIEQKKFKKPLTAQQIFDYFDHFRYIIPQGSPMYGIGNPHQIASISNCFVVDSPLDSYGSILETDAQLVQISKRRGGVGTDLSHLRPNQTPTNNAARTSSGIVPFMQRYSNSIREVGQDGRRGALMLTLCAHHPQIIDFARSKIDNTKVTGANISIRLSDEFLRAVEADEDYEQRWPVDSAKPKISKKVSSKRVWREIIELAHQTAEPGLIFWDTLIRESPADCYAEFGFRTISTNPCGELPLPALDSCRLLLKNLLSFVKDAYRPGAFFDYDKFYEYSKVAQRLMDDMIDLEVECVDKIIAKIHSDPEPMGVKQKELEMWSRVRKMAVYGRRTGTGLTGWGDAIAALGLKFGSEEAIQLVGEISKVFKHACYESSIEMAEELGSFPIWGHELEKDNPFLLRLGKERPDLWERMKSSGRRNIALLTTAPAGSVSIEAQVTSSGEPMFALSFTRKRKINPNDTKTHADSVDQNGDRWTHYTVHEHGIKRWMKATGETDITKSPYYGCTAHDINWENRVKMQAAAQKHIDHSISSTINLPTDISVEEVQKIYETAWKSGCKGVTVYREGCRTGVLVTNKPQTHLVKTVAPKRPKSLPAQMFHPTLKGQKYFVAVGLMDDEVYEVFAGKNGQIHGSTGRIEKIRRGHYTFLDEDGTIVVDNLAELCSEDEEALLRVISTALRHGSETRFLTEQLEKTRGGMESFAKVIARVLKRYIPDGARVSGDSCQACGHPELHRENGCVLCRNCGWTKCQ